MRFRRGVSMGLVLVGAVMAAAWPARAEPSCEASYPSTFALIQKAIFENKGCASAVCHGEAMSSGLDLRAGASYDSLVSKLSHSVPGWERVIPGQPDDSLLFVNLAAKTLPGEFHAPLRAMPLDPLPALSANEVEAVRRWIEFGASRDGVVAKTGELLNACLPPPKPITIDPLPPPAAGEGVQLHMPRLVLARMHEQEVCFATYFDVTDKVPAEFRDPTGTKFRLKRSQIRQDPLSHHMIAFPYTGTAAPDDPAWGEFTCRGGAHDGAGCDPTALGECGDGECATEPVPSIGCIGFGPPDAGFGFNTFGVTGTQQTAVQHTFADGVYTEFPLKGIITWNSHSFNLTDTPGKLEAWINLTFASPAEQENIVENIFDANHIFAMSVPAFTTQEVCNTFLFPPNSHVFEITSHTHRHGKRFRAFRGSFTCTGGANAGAACEPLGTDFVSPDICAGAPCRSTRTIHIGDCNFDDSVTVDELVASMNIALGDGSADACVRADVNGDREITVDELVASVQTALTGAASTISRDATTNMLYLSLVYNDPTVVRFDPPMDLPGTQSLADERTFTYCSLYDNGYSNPSEVKTRSNSPPAVIGGPCYVPTNCVAGHVGAACGGKNDAERNASCDSVPSRGDGVCDACPVHGGVTTEDEMFLLLGSYFVR